MEHLTLTQTPPTVPLPVNVVADLQESLLMAMTDLQRLEGLLDHATANLLERFSTANQALAHLSNSHDGDIDSIRQALHQAVTELQFHDMSSQLIAHMAHTLQACAFRLGAAAMGVDEDEAETDICLPSLPEKPNPVTQSEMDAGSVELF